MILHPISEDNDAVTVCGGRIKDASLYPSALYRGERVFFCALACMRAFEANHDPFMAGEIQHPSGED